jgi:trigger factor
MQAKLTKKEDLNQLYEITIEAKDLSQAAEIRLAEIALQAQIPGFRPGKIPPAILKKKFGSSALSEVVDKSINDSVQNVIKEHDLKPIGRPKVDIVTFEEGKNLVFTLDLETMPDIEIKSLDTIQLERPITEVSEEAINEELDRIASSQEKSEPLGKNSTAKQGDIVVIDFVGSINGVKFEGGAGENHSLKLGSNSFIPGFEDQLIGSKAEQQKTITVTFPDNYGQKDLAGKIADFDVKIHEVRKIVPSTIDNDFAKAYGFDTLDAMRDQVRKNISNEYDHIARSHLKRGLMDQLSSHYDFIVPRSLSETEFSTIWQQVEHDRSHGNIDPDDQGKSDEELKNEYLKIAERRVRLGLIFAEIGKKNNINVTQEEIYQAIVNQSRNYPGQEKLLFDYYKNNPDAMMSLQSPIYEEKVVDFIVSQAKVTDVPFTLEQLMNDDTVKETKPSKKPKKKASDESVSKTPSTESESKTKKTPRKTKNT